MRRTHLRYLAVCVWTTLLAAGCTSDGKLSLFGSSAPADDEGQTILLLVVSGSDHVEQANQCRATAESMTRWRGIFVVHEENTSSVFWGHHASVKDAQKDLERARQWQGAGDSRPFAAAMIVPTPGENPGRPEHDLRAASGYYTLVVAHFHNDPEKGIKNRKQWAVEYCEELRGKGVEAYYLHGPKVSMVTVGSFPADAYVTMEHDGIARAVPRDEGLKKAWERFPFLAVNGYAEMITEPGQRKKKAAASYELPIPRRTVSTPIPDRAGYAQPR